MSALTIFFALLFYAAAAMLAGGVARKCWVYARTPQPLKIPVPPAPTTRRGVVLRLLLVVWFYVPSTRRVRRVNSATRSDPIAGMDIFGDDLNCYAGKVEYYKWKLIGEGNVLAGVPSPEPLLQKKLTETRNEVDIPYFTGAYETPGAKGVPWAIVQNLVMIPRPVWILEGQSDDPFYNFGKVIMYMDKDLYRIWWKLVHNRAGEYFYNAMCAFHWSTNDDVSYKTVTPNMIVGVNGKTNRSATSSWVFREQPTTPG